MTSARADEAYLNDEDLVFDLEEESDIIDDKKFNKFAKYLIFISYWHINNLKSEFLKYKPSNLKNFLSF